MSNKILVREKIHFELDGQRDAVVNEERQFQVILYHLFLFQRWEFWCVSLYMHLDFIERDRYPLLPFPPLSTLR